MPDVSKAQKKLMNAVAHGWRKPGGGGPSQKVAQDFVNADKAQGVTNASLPAYASGSRGPRKKLGGHLHLTRHRKGVR